MKVSDEILQKLHLAIDAAELAGRCQYVSDGEPCCVIGQFAYLQGISVETMIDWGCWHVSATRCDTSLEYSIPDLGAPRGLLKTLQVLWDSAQGSEGDRRIRMHKIVNEFNDLPEDIQNQV